MTVQGTAIAGGKISETMRTDDNGVADFGPLPAGEYLTTFIADEQRLSTSKSLLLGPGRANRAEATSPASPPGTFRLTIEIQPPDGLKDIPLYYLANVQYRSQREGDETWGLLGREQGPILLLDKSGKILGQTDYERVTIEEKASGSSAYYVSFLERIGSDFPFAPAEDLRAYDMVIDFWPLVSNPDVEQSEGPARPPLTRLTGAALQGSVQVTPTAGQPRHVHVDPKRKQFWDDIASDLRRMPKYKELADSGRL